MNRNKFRSIYKFMTMPRLRYSLLAEGMRRLFFTYDTREFIMSKIMEWAFFRNLEGDYMEFGVYRGDSFIKAFHFARFANLPSMKFYAFDSFSGYPPLEGVDKECGYFKEGAYSCDLSSFEKNLKKGGCDMSKVIITPGLFSELEKVTREKKIKSRVASVVWIDCDLYSPTQEALNFLVDYITDGTVIVFADWLTCNGAPDMGQPKAVHEWLEQHPETRFVEFMNMVGAKAFVVSQPEKQKINKVFPTVL